KQQLRLERLRAQQQLEEASVLRRLRVSYLDCDVGQPEFSPAGLMSLLSLKRPFFGQPCSHLVEPSAGASSSSSLSSSGQQQRRGHHQQQQQHAGDDDDGLNGI